MTSTYPEPNLRISEFSDGWKLRKIGQITERIKSYNISHKLEVKQDTGVKSLHYGEIHRGYLNRIKNFDSLPNVVDDDYACLKKGDVIVADASEDLPGLGESCFIAQEPQNEKVVAGLHTLVLRPSENLDPDFLFAYLKTIQFKRYIYQVATGLKVYSLAPTALTNFKLRVPSLAEQKAVTKPLTLIQDEIELNYSKKAAYEKLRSDFISNAIINNRTIAKKKLKNYIHYKKKTIFPNKIKDRQYYEFSMPAFDEDGKPALKSGKKMRSTRFILDEPCILFNKLNVYKKRIWNLHHIPENSVSSAEFLPIICENINQDYLFEILRSDYLTSQIIALSIGSSNSQKRLHPSDLLQISIPMPDLAEQAQLAEIISCFNDSINEIDQKIKKLISLRDFLLKNTFI